VKDFVHLPLGRLQETEIAADRCLALPFFSNLKNEQIEYVAEELRHAVAAECDVTEVPVGAQGRLSDTGSTLRERV
jgi:hypothetical protein